MSGGATSGRNWQRRLRATERLKALATRYGADRLVAYMAEVLDYSERLMRAALSDLPDGEGAFRGSSATATAFPIIPTAATRRSGSA